MLYEFAPAKINLYLHITGRRTDGYHDLDSLVAFAGIGDEIRLKPSRQFRFFIEGPQAPALKGESLESNLAVKAAKSLAELCGKPLDVALTLIKNLPVASGIGGGSSDAAASLRLLAKYWGLAGDDPRLMEAATQHGQDTALCLKIENRFMTATGSSPAPNLPFADILLVNPNKPLPTAGVYKTYREGGSTFSPLVPFKGPPADLDALVQLLRERGNDLQTAAIQHMPQIRTVLDVLQTTGDCLLARMSGSGATCFALYSNRGGVRKAAASILEQHPQWWVAQSYIPCRADPRQSF